MIMALNEVARLTGGAEFRREAIALLDRTLGWIRTPGSLGKEELPGAPALAPLNVPMIILNVISELAAVRTRGVVESFECGVGVGWGVDVWVC